MRSSSAVVTLASGCVLFLACGLFDAPSSSVPEDDVPNDFRVIGANGSRLVAGNGDGLVYTSPDGVKWEINLQLQRDPPAAVFADDQVLLAIGDKSFARALAATPDYWAHMFTNYSAPLSAIGACLGAHYIVGGAGYVKRSTDGSTFVNVDGIPQTVDLVGVACGPSSVLIGSAKQTSGHWLSTDGTKFTNTTSPADTCAVGYANGVFLDLATNGQVYTSPDAKTWKPVGMPLWSATVTSCKLVSDADTLVAAGGGKVWVSPPDPAFKEWVTEEDGPIFDVSLPPGGQLRAVAQGKLLTSQCTSGSCDPPVVTQPKVQNPGTSAPPSDGTSSSSSSSSSGSSGGCGGCTTDDDCTGVAQRHGAVAAACNPDDHLCYACEESCSAGGSNCVCIKCSEGCGGGAECVGPTYCSYKMDGAKPCE